MRWTHSSSATGGGKVEEFGLLGRAQELGVETVLLDHGLDLEQLARDAIAGGADCLGMAGGDGAQALVASISIEHDIPFVCVAAGTPNHLTLGLGLDREDPRGPARTRETAWTPSRMPSSGASTTRRWEIGCSSTTSPLVLS